MLKSAQRGAVLIECGERKAAPSTSRKFRSRLPAEPGAIVELTIAGHDGKHLLAA